MNKLKNYAGFIVVASILLSLGFKADTGAKKIKPGETLVNVYIDDMSPGPITIKQMVAAKIIRATSESGTNYKIKSFTMIMMPRAGAPSRIMSFIGNRFKDLSTKTFAGLSKGDKIAIANIVIENLDKYKPVVPAMWTIAGEAGK